MKFLDLAPHIEISKKEIMDRVEKVFSHGMFIMGPEVTELESALSKYTGAKHAIACSNGTTALQLALMAIDIKPGDEVIVPAFTFYATSEAVSVLGATPVFVDVNFDDFNINTDAAKAAFTDKTKAIIPVSLFGQPSDMTEINNWAKQNNIHVIEDAAQSFGSSINDIKSCNLSELATTSFFPAKPLGGFGDGGAVFTNDDRLAHLLVSIRNHGSEERYAHHRIGINGRLDSLSCSFLVERLKHYDADLKGRQKVADFYLKNLADIPQDQLSLPNVAEGKTSAWAQFTLKTEKRDELRSYLSEKDIPTAVHYPAILPEQPVYKNNISASRSLDMTTSLKLSKMVMSLPLYPHMGQQDMETICNEIKNFFNN
ncbi:MAG: DegT/DnrJ/EryC1/StrS family aminotransferase [Bdellovibrionaceae bacterium]|jgi:UDP-2-acetamido-2-deoxy-ribo-hexuluronate aminotransferase|nr:DegT/DnrJ/EryC1/StrS family aminotransferase [Pseudobdellovibrionaceae bacterium]